MRGLRYIFLATILFSIHLALLSYLNSSMLSAFSSPRLVSLYYTLASAISLVVIFVAPRLLRRIGNVRLLIGLLLTGATLLWTIGSAVTPIAVITAFILYFSLNISILYSFDIFIEHYSRKSDTGHTRGLYLTLTSSAWVLMPILVSVILKHIDVRVIYLIGSLILLIVTAIVVLSQRKFTDKPYTTPDFVRAFKLVVASPVLRRIVAINFVVQLFFVWMVIYSPLYLLKIGFGWGSIGVIFGCMLLAFPLLQYPTGRLADKFGEKRFLMAGLLVASIATLCFALYSGAILVIFAAILFFTRSGIAVVEVMADTYFFKQVLETESETISVYRAMVPLAYIIGPVTAALIIGAFSYSALFITLAGVLMLALVYARRIVDIRG